MYNLDLNYLVFGESNHSSKQDHELNFIDSLMQYIKSKYPLSEIGHNSGEIKIIKGEIDKLIDRLAQYLIH